MAQILNHDNSLDQLFLDIGGIQIVIGTSGGEDVDWYCANFSQGDLDTEIKICSSKPGADLAILPFFLRDVRASSPTCKHGKNIWKFISAVFRDGQIYISFSVCKAGLAEPVVIKGEISVLELRGRLGLYPNFS